MDEPTGRGGLRDAAAWLFVPADKSDRWLETALAAGPDVIVLDLEDAVAPDGKEAARETARLALARARPAMAVAFRVNGLGTPWHEADLAFVATVGAAAVLLPKVARAVDVERAVAGLAASGLTAAHRPALVPIVETAAGVLHAEEIAAVADVVAVALGGEDLAADLGVRRSVSGEELAQARGHLALACAAAGRGAIDTPVVDPRAIDQVGGEAALARGLGFTGKLAIHPAQVGAIRTAFAPSADELEWAAAVIEALARARRQGSGIAVLDGRMVDAAVATAARRLLSRAGNGPAPR